MIDRKIDVNCNFWDFDSNLIYLSYCNHLIYKKYTVLFGIQLGMLVPLICPYTQEPDHWNHLQWKLVTQQFDCQQAENVSARWHLQERYPQYGLSSPVCDIILWHPSVQTELSWMNLLHVITSHKPSS
jgi:hypothetical protein